MPFKHKHQIGISSKRGRNAAGRKYRRQEKERLIGLKKLEAVGIPKEPHARHELAPEPPTKAKPIITLGELVFGDPPKEDDDDR